MTVGKGKRKRVSVKDKFDTSKCQVKFRNPRVDVDRDTSFDPDRDLNFNHNRMIEARLSGVVFRDHFAIGFRNTGIGNIEEIASKDDWPEVEPAKSPSSLVVERDRDWDKTWGRDQSYKQRWGSDIDRHHETSIYPAPRIEPQLTYYESKSSGKGRKKSKAKARKKSTPKNEIIDYNTIRSDLKKKAQAQRMTLLETGREPIHSPPSRNETSPPYQVVFDDDSRSGISPKDRKRGYAFNEYALSLMESGQYDRAMKYFKKARDLDPYEETYRTNMNRCQQWIDYRTRGR